MNTAENSESLHMHIAQLGIGGNIVEHEEAEPNGLLEPEFVEVTAAERKGGCQTRIAARRRGTFLCSGIRRRCLSHTEGIRNMSVSNTG